MKKIDKSNILADNYKKWIDELESKNEIHPAYKTSGKYYSDIVANLLSIQNGLCAYSEIFLCDIKELHPDYWEHRQETKIQFKGHLDHYNPSLKEHYGWRWENLFIIDADINVKVKGIKIPKGVLKPDEENYDPFLLLAYNMEKHIFYPNSNLDYDLQQNILYDISVLGLNWEPIISWRKKYLTPIFNKIIFEQSDFNTEKESLYQFQTAFMLSEKQLC